ncbi:hypothetical protein ACFL6X_00190 [Candidatus Latescibacterota bacterium]
MDAEDTSPHPLALDLREPVGRALRWLRSTDPRALAATPGQGWWHGWGYGDVTGRMVEAFALARRVLGESVVGPEEDRTRRFLESLFDSPDGLSWRPDTPFRRRAAHMFDQSSVLFGLVAWLEESGDPSVAARLERLVGALSAIAVWDDDWCRYPLEVYTPSGWVADYDEFRDRRKNVAADPCHEGGRQIQPLTRYWELSGDGRALALAEGLTRFIVDHSGVFEPDGSFLERDSRAAGHVHSRLGTAAGVLRLGLLRGRHDWTSWAKTVFDWTMANVASSFGWISERAHSSAGGCETCCLADALDLSVTLADSGHRSYWDLAERLIRNHLLESQCPTTGGFSGHTMPNDFCWVHHVTGEPEHHVGGCCSPAGVRALWLAWDSITSRQGDDIHIHLPLSRQSPDAEVVSSLPWKGRVAVTVLRACDLMLRIPEWTDHRETRIAVAGVDHPPVWSGPYARVARLAPGDRVVATFPVREEPRRESFMDFHLTVTWRGNTVTAVEPPGRIEPLYLREG